MNRADAPDIASDDRRLYGRCVSEYNSDLIRHDFVSYGDRLVGLYMNRL